MQKEALIAKLEYRTSTANAQRIAESLGDALISRMQFVKDGTSTSVFSIEGSNLVFKASDRQQEKNERISHSRFMPQANCRASVQDDVALDDKNQPREAILEVEPEMSHDGVTRLHQEMLRYMLWTQEGLEFWDYLPATSNPSEIKNVMLDHRGVPYQIDDDAVRRFDDRWNQYPPDGDGKRSDEQYLHYRADSWNEMGRSDAIDTSYFQKIKAACAQCDWPVRQKALYEARIDRKTIAAFEQAFDALTPQLQVACR
jgi:hypothetical protein